MVSKTSTQGRRFETEIGRQEAELKQKNDDADKLIERVGVER